MQLLTGKEVLSRIEGVLNAKYQVHGTAVDLTVKNIYAVDPVGRVDFGGTEYVPAGKVAIAPQRYAREDKYHWWDLSRGAYLVEFNETLQLADDELGLLEPDERLLRAGASHVAHFMRGHVAPLETLLDVSTLRLQIKQNARISRVRIFRLAAPVPTTAPKALAGAAPGKARRKPGRRRSV